VNVTGGANPLCQINPEAHIVVSGEIARGARRMEARAARWCVQRGWV
jgi:hypothetical protein